MQADFLSGGSFAANVAGLTASGAATTFSTANVLHFNILGDGFTKAAVSGGTTPTTDVNGNAITLTAGFARAVVWAVNSSGTVVNFAGPIVPWDGGTAAPNYGFGNLIPAIPSVGNSYAPFAVTVVKAGSTTSGTWTFGSSNWNATGITVAHHNIMFNPPRPFLV
jgi:hypothetical protein